MYYMYNRRPYYVQYMLASRIVHLAGWGRGGGTHIYIIRNTLLAPVIWLLFTTMRAQKGCP